MRYGTDIIMLFSMQFLGRLGGACPPDAVEGQTVGSRRAGKFG
jgi:hypothetical protein